MAYPAAELVLARTVAIGGHGGTGWRLVLGSGGSGDMLHLIAGPLLIEVRAGVEESDHLIRSHVDLQEKADQGKARRVGQVRAFGDHRRASS